MLGLELKKKSCDKEFLFLKVLTEIDHLKKAEKTRKTIFLLIASALLRL
jgi:hypothetical protein